MMYAYRDMSPQERRAVVRNRKALRVHWHKPAHPTLGKGWYFLTAATYEHQPHFSTPPELTALERRLLEAFDAAEAPYTAWVVMPNHYHALVYAEELPRLGRFLGMVHGRSARYANRRDETPGRRVWYRFSDRKVRSERHYWACVHYILINPVKHAYIADAMDWPWSCIHDIVARNGSGWLDNLKREFPLHDFGCGWDD